MLSTLVSAVVAVVLFAVTSAAAFDKNDHTGGKGGGKPDKSLGVSGMAMARTGATGETARAANPINSPA